MGTDSPRRHLRIRPTDAPLDPTTVTDQFRRLHRVDAGDRSLRDRLGGHDRPTLEWLLVTDGDPETTLTYAVGIDSPDAEPALERHCRGLFPNEYELTWSDRDPLAVLPPVEADDTAAPTAVEFRGVPDRREDWQTGLMPFERFAGETDTRLPLATLAETLADRAVPTAFQVLVEPYPDVSDRIARRRQRIRQGRDTPGQRLVDAWLGPTGDDDAVETADTPRLAELDTTDARHAFSVTARIVAPTTDPDVPLATLTPAFESVSHTCYAVRGRQLTGADAEKRYAHTRERVPATPTYDGLRARLPWTSVASPAIIADATAVPGLCLLDGTALTAAAARALAPTPSERTPLPRPPADQLDRYRGPGLALGQPLDQDGTPDGDPLVVPPALQPLHVGWFGKTGSGKSTSLITGLLANHQATAGADVLIDPKGDGMAADYCRAHYATHGDLDDVYYFDCAATLPAFSFFDVRAELEAGVPRATAVEDTVDHYVEVLRQVMGADQYEQAIRSPDVIRYLLKALFDPVHGDDAFTHRDLHSAVRRMHERQSAPSVSDPDLERMLGGVVANRAQTFDEIMQGVANRIEKVPVDRRLARVFNHLPDGESDPHFDLAAHLNEDVVIIFDTGGLRREAQRVLATVVLSNLWSALRRRSRRGDDGPLVNLYLEEAASIAVTDLLTDLLAQSRGFGCAVTLAMQFPGQLRELDPAAYDEVLNNVSTFVTGNVPLDDRLARRLATDAMPPAAVGARLRALQRGQWLVSLPAPFDEPAPSPFLLASLSPPPGDPAGDAPLGPPDRDAFQATLDACRDRTRETVGLRLAEPRTTPDESAAEDADGAAIRVDTALPYTTRLPPTVEYAPSIHALRCTACDARYDPSAAGMSRAIDCCGDRDAVDPDDVPICALNLKLTPEERVASDWTDAQLRFLQAVYNAQQLRYDPPAYDLLHDSMLRLQEYVDVADDAVDALLASDLLRHDTDHPHRLYTVTPAGREAIGEQYRRGVDYGHGAGDLAESSQHVFGVEVTRQWLVARYVDDPDSDVVEVIPYYELDDTHRLDVAGVDADGDVRVAAEIERVNNDLARAVPEDFDTIAACDVDAAIWVVMSRDAGHAVVDALHDPPEGEPRVAKTYSVNTPPRQFSFDTPGLTAMYTVKHVRDTLLPDA